MRTTIPTTPPTLPPAIPPTFEVLPFSGDVEAVEDAEEITKSVCQFCPCEEMALELNRGKSETRCHCGSTRSSGHSVSCSKRDGSGEAQSFSPTALSSTRFVVHPGGRKCLSNRQASNSIGRGRTSILSPDRCQCQGTLCCTALPTLDQYKPLESSAPCEDRGRCRDRSRSRRSTLWCQWMNRRVQRLGREKRHLRSNMPQLRSDRAQ